MRFRLQPAAGALGFVAALAMGAVAFPRPATARPPISDSAAARAEGTRLYRAKNFEAACPKFEKAAQLAPADPEPLADLALCRQRLGDTGAAEKVNRQVIDLGSTGKALTDPRFARSRRHAYFNLRQIETQLRYFPEVGFDICGELNPEEGCSKKLFYCGDSWTGGGSWMTQNYTRVNIAASAEAARFDEDDTDLYTREHTEPDFDELTQAFQPAPEVVETGESVTYLESYSNEVNEWRCDENAWSCDRSDAVAADAKKCLASAAKAPTSAEACRKDACNRANDRPWPAVIKERKVAAAAERSCHASAAENGSEYGCQIAYANACTGLVGLICSGRYSLKAKARTRVEEYLFLPPPGP
jgi:tetratricopeptide (TPR) repeat protein